MEVIMRGQSMPGQVRIQIEDWSQSYPGLFGKAATLSAFPLVTSQAGMPPWMRRAYCPGVDRIRIAYQFPNAQACESAFNGLCEGKARFSDFAHYAGPLSAPRLKNVALDEQKDGSEGASGTPGLKPGA